ncbi:MAG: ribonuclease HII [Alphaproteobacteria bacterium]|nr:ribonuclease HII [Alphaproteobacteria bacterium]
MPDFVLERDLGGIVCGIDEVGRGPWAGPVVAAAVVLDPGRMPDAVLAALDDSKKVPAERRVVLAREIRAHALVGIGAASAREIDRINVLRATFVAMARALARLPCRPDAVLVDGNQAPPLGCRVVTVVGGDGRSLSIAAASIVAKVVRDALMVRLASRHPGYGWETNVGYGTEAHRDALARFGTTVHHRRSFAPISHILSLMTR